MIDQGFVEDDSELTQLRARVRDLENRCNLYQKEAERGHAELDRTVGIDVSGRPLAARIYAEFHDVELLRHRLRESYALLTDGRITDITAKFSDVRDTATRVQDERETALLRDAVVDAFQSCAQHIARYGLPRTESV